MDKLFSEISSFLAIWFNDMKSSVWKVKVESSDISTKKLEDNLSKILKTLEDSAKKTMEVVVKNQSEVDLTALESGVLELSKAINLLPKQDNSKVEQILSDLIKATNSLKEVEYPEKVSIDGDLTVANFPKLQEVSGEVKVSNLPKIQQVAGDLTIKNFPKKQSVDGEVKVSNIKDVIDGLQVVVDSINDLKINLSHEMKGMGTAFVGQTGSRGSIKITDGENDATLTSVGSRNALLTATVSEAPAIVVVESGSVTYMAEAPAGTSTSSASWRVRKMDETSGLVVTWADGNQEFDNVASSLASLTYS